MSENGVMSLMCPVLPHWGTGGSSCIVPTDTHVYRVLIHLQHSVQSSTIIHSFQPAHLQRGHVSAHFDGRHVFSSFISQILQIKKLQYPSFFCVNHRLNTLP